jgi:hypothetical protein
MADYKTLQTRIALKYDTYQNWTNEDSPVGQGKNLVLLKGEIGLCEIPTGNTTATTAPTVLFKVGDGTHKFHELNWASALAADVHTWAKASNVEVDGKTIKFIGGKIDDNGNKVDKVLTLNFITPEEVTAITNPLAERVSDLESALGIGQTGDQSVSSRLTAAEAALDDILGHEADTENGIEAKVGLIDAAEAAANAYTDAREVEIKKYADQAEADAVDAAGVAAEALVAVERQRITVLEEADADQDVLIAANTKAITDEVKAREEADKAINAKIGGSYSATATVEMAIADAKKAGTDAAEAVNTLKTTEVKANEDAIKKNKEDIAALVEALNKEVKDRGDADNGLDDRLEKIEAFFAGADHDGIDNELNDALDTLVEIQNFLNGEGQGVENMLDAIQANADDIEALEEVVGDANGGLVKDMAAAKENISSLQSVVSGYTAAGAIKAAIEEADRKGQQGIADASTADGKASNAQERVGVLEGYVGVPSKTEGEETIAATGLFASMATAEADIDGLDGRLTTAEEDIDNLEDRMDTAEGAISTLKGIVQDGDDSNAQLRADIEALEAIVVDGADGNVALGLEIDTVAATVNHATAGLAATKKIADDNTKEIGSLKERVSAVEGDYLKAADWFVIDCGTSALRTGEPVAPIN